MPGDVTNIIVAGLGGQGVLTAADILVDAAFAGGHDVKKSEIHGMSQRGGSVHSDVRFGARILSPMIPDGEADFLVVLADDQAAVNAPRLRAGGRVLGPADVAGVKLPNPRALNVALLGALSAHLPLAAEAWDAAIRKHLAPRIQQLNLDVFRAARALGATPGGGSAHA
jgi:indolepyruvate ferredoxin oxidoreductase, beta subunit